MKPSAETISCYISIRQSLTHSDYLGSANSKQQYEAEEIKLDGTSLSITEKFNFFQPSCPNIDKDGDFEDFNCFDYLEDTVRTKEETTTNSPPTTPPEVIPPSHIAIMSGFGAAIFLVIIAIVIYKIRQK